MDNLPFKDRLLEFIQVIDKIYPLEMVYLFGSVAKGTDHSESDIDLALLFKQKYEEREELLILGRLMDEGEKFLGKKVDVVSLGKASTLLKYQVIREGIVLKDSVQRGTFESLALREYFDFRYYSAIYNRAMLKHLNRGTYFGGDAGGK